MGTRFEPPVGGLEDLARRRDRARARRRIATGALALAVAAGGSLFAMRAFSAAPPAPHPTSRVATSPSPSASVTPSPTVGAAVECPTPTGDSPPPVVLSSTSAPTGSSVDASIRFVNGATWYQLWWNADSMMPDTVSPPPWPPTGPDLQLNPAGPGPVVRLLAVPGPAAAGDCTVQSTFTVPDVDPGTYHLMWMAGWPVHTTEPSSPDGAFVLYASNLTFTVTG